MLGGNRTRLSAVAVDDLGNPLKGKALSWFAGHRKLGTGATLNARLPAGKVTLRLRAREAGGPTRIVTERVNVTAQRLRVLTISVPQRVGKKAHTVTITLRMSARSKLIAAGHPFIVRTKATKLTIPLPKKPAVGLLKVPFRVTATNHAVKGTLRGSIWVIRT